MLKHVHLYLFLFGYVLGVSSQEFDVDSKIYIQNESIFEIKNDSIIEYNPINYNVHSRKLIKNLDNIDLSDYDLLNYDSIYLYKKTGGLLYELINNEIIRIDNSYDHKLHKHSLKFFYDNQIHILGGYGFFNRRSDIIYFSSDKKEWYSKTLKGSIPQKGINDINFHSLNGDILTFCGGFTSNKENNYVGVKLNDCFKTDLKTLETKTISGEISDIFQNKPRDYIKVKNNLWLFYDTLLIVLDVENNSGKSFKIDHSVFKVIGYINENLYFLERSTQQDNIFMGKINMERLLNQKGEQIELSKNPYIKYIVFTLIFLFIILFIFFYKKINQTKNILVFDSNKLNFQNKSFSENETWLLIIQSLIEKKILKNDQILNLIGNNDLDIGHQNRIKNNLISNINQRSNHLTKQDLILSKKWDKDNRIKVYYLNKTVVKQS